MAVRITGQVTGIEKSVQNAIRKINTRGGVNLRLNDRSFTQPLGRITAQVSEFNKSLEASNARVIAFGASVGILNSVKDAFEGIVKSTVRVEKALADVNIVLNASSADLQKFSRGLFDAARNTGQSFNVVSQAATEFARQGLGVEETLKRTNDALILTRLTGMDAAESVKSLTAAMNTFQKAGLTSTQVISKMAAVDVEFAVSADDLAAAISRTGQSAVEAGVSIDQLIGLVTAAQQRTARGGAVIGNAFKTILTRIRRPETLKQMEELGIAVRDVQYNTLPAVQILNNLASTYDRLSDAQKSSLGQTVAGVFQINILKAALADASQGNSILARATQISAGASNEAIVKNEKLNQTLDALGKQTAATFTEVAKSIGDIAVGPGLKNILQVLNSFGESVSTNIDGEGAGSKFFQGFLRGVGHIVTGPGLVLFGGIIIKLFAGATKFASSALKDVLGITTQAQKLKQVEEGILQALGRNAGLQEALLGLEGSRTAQEKVILELIKQQTNALASQQAIARHVAPSLVRKGVGGQLTLPRGGRVPNLSATNYETGGNFIPNFASPIQNNIAIPLAGEINSPYSQVKFDPLQIEAIRKKMKLGNSAPIGLNEIPFQNLAKTLSPKIIEKYNVKTRQVENLSVADYRSAKNALLGMDGASMKKFITAFPTASKGSSRTASQRRQDKVDAERRAQLSKMSRSGRFGRYTPNFSAIPNFAMGWGAWLKANPTATDGDLLSSAEKGDITKGGIHGFARQGNTEKLSRAVNEFNNAKGSGKLTSQGILAAQLAQKNVPGTAKVRGRTKKARPTQLMFDGSKYAAVVPNKGSNIKLTYSHVQSDILKGTPLPTGSKIGVQNLDLLRMKNPNKFKKSLDGNLDRMLRDLGNELTGGGRLGKTPKPRFNQYVDEAGGPQLKGRLFEAVLNYVGGAVQKEIPGGERWDFKEGLPGKVPQIYGIKPNTKPSDAKFNMNPGSGGRKSMIEKIMLEELGAKGKADAAKKLGGLKLKSGQVTNFSAWNYTPNFSPVSSAIKREVSTGVPRSAVRVATHSSLKSPVNPRGLGVFNRMHEPKGLSQGIRRARSEGRSPRTYGMPNFAFTASGASVGEFRVGGSSRFQNNPTGRTAEQQSLQKGYNNALKKAILSYEDGRRSRKQMLAKVDKLSQAYGLEDSARKRINSELSRQTQLTKNLTATGEKAKAAYNNLISRVNRTALGQGMAMGGRFSQSGGGFFGAAGRFQSGQGRGAAGAMGRGLRGFGGMGLMMGGSMLAGFADTAAQDQMARGDTSGAANSMRLGGAASGMATGASIGMMFGPIGIAAGAAAGGLIGLVTATEKSKKALEEHAVAQEKERLAKATSSRQILSQNLGQLLNEPGVRARLIKQFQQPGFKERITTTTAKGSETMRAIESAGAMQEIVKIAKAGSDRLAFGAGTPKGSHFRMFGSGGLNTQRKVTDFERNEEVGGQIDQQLLKLALDNASSPNKKIATGKKQIGRGKFQNFDLTVAMVADSKRMELLGMFEEEYTKDQVEMIKNLSPSDFLTTFFNQNIGKDGKLGKMEVGGAGQKEALGVLDAEIEKNIENFDDIAKILAGAIGPKAEILVNDSSGQVKKFTAATFLQKTKELAKSPEQYRILLDNVRMTMNRDADKALELKAANEKIFTIDQDRTSVSRMISTRGTLSRQRIKNTSDISSIGFQDQLSFGQTRGSLTNTQRASIENQRRQAASDADIEAMQSKFNDEQALKLIDKFTASDKIFSGTGRDEILAELKDALNDPTKAITPDFVKNLGSSKALVEGTGKHEFDQIIKLLDDETTIQKGVVDGLRAKLEAVKTSADAQAKLTDLIEKERLERESDSIARRGRLNRGLIQSKGDISIAEMQGQAAITRASMSGRGLTTSERLGREQALETQISNQNLGVQRKEAERSSRNSLIQALESTLKPISDASQLAPLTAAEKAERESINQRKQNLATFRATPLNEMDKVLDGKTFRAPTQKEADAQAADFENQIKQDEKNLISPASVEEYNKEVRKLIKAAKEGVEIDENDLKNKLEMFGLNEEQLKTIHNALTTYEESEKTATDDQAVQKRILRTRLQIAGDLDAQRKLVSSGISSAVGDIRDELQGFGAMFGENTTMSFLNNLEKGLNDVVSGSKNAKEAFMGFANGVFQEIQRMLTRRMSLQITEAIFGGQGGVNMGGFYDKLSGGGGGGGGIFSGIKTFGKSILNFMGLPFNEGGMVPAMVQGGEYLFGKDAVKRIGANNLNALNSGTIAKFATGGRLSARAIANPDPELGTIFGLREQKARQDAQYAQQLRDWKKARKRAAIGAFINTFVSMGINKMAGGMGKGAYGAGKAFGGAGDVLPATGGPMSMPGTTFASRGGLIKGGSGAKDDIPTVLQGGEFVMRKSAVEKYGRSFMDRLNAGMNEGGYTGGEKSSPNKQESSGQSPNVTININLGEGAETEAQASSSNQTSEQAQQNREFAQKIKSVVLQTIRQEQRVGGTLNKKNAGQ